GTEKITIENCNLRSLHILTSQFSWALSDCVSPDLNLRRQPDAVGLSDLFLYRLNQLPHIIRLGPGVGHDEIGMPIGDVSPADAETLEAGAVDELSGRLAVGVLKNTTGALVA